MLEVNLLTNSRYSFICLRWMLSLRKAFKLTSAACLSFGF